MNKSFDINKYIDEKDREYLEVFSGIKTGGFKDLAQQYDQFKKEIFVEFRQQFNDLPLTEIENYQKELLKRLENRYERAQYNTEDVELETLLYKEQKRYREFVSELENLPPSEWLKEYNDGFLLDPERLATIYTINYWSNLFTDVKLRLLPLNKKVFLKNVRKQGKDELLPYFVVRSENDVKLVWCCPEFKAGSFVTMAIKDAVTENQLAVSVELSPETDEVSLCFQYDVEEEVTLGQLSNEAVRTWYSIKKAVNDQKEELEFKSQKLVFFRKASLDLQTIDIPPFSIK